MRRLSLIASIVLFALVMPVFGQDEPVPARKPLRFWVERLSHKDPKVRERAVEFLESEAVLEGIYLLGILDPPTRKKLEAFRKEAKPLIPELLEVLKSTNETLDNADAEGNVAETATQLLMILGPEAQSVLPEIKRIVIDKNAGDMARIYGISVLMFVTPGEKPVGPFLLKHLNSLSKEAKQNVFGGDQDTKKDDKRKQSVKTRSASFVYLTLYSYISSILYSGHTKSEVPSLVTISEGDYPSSIRLQAILCLGTLAFDAKPAIPALLKLLKDADSSLRSLIVLSLSAIDPNPKLVLKIVEALELNGKEREDYEKKMREYFKQLEQGRREYVLNEDERARLVNALKYGNSFYRRQTILFLGQIGPNAKSVVPELRKLLKDPDEDIRRMAAEAIKQIETEVVTSDGK